MTTITARAMPEYLATSARNQALWEKFNERDLQLKGTYERMLRLLDEHIRRHEAEMFSAPGEPEFNPRLSRAAEGLGRALERITKLYLTHKAELQKALDAKMSIEEQIEYAVQFIQDLPSGLRMRLFDEISSRLSVTIYES